MQWQRDLEEREWEIFNFHLQAELQQHSEEGLRHWFQMERLINPTGTPSIEEAGDKGVSPIILQQGLVRLPFRLGLAGVQLWEIWKKTIFF